MAWLRQRHIARGLAIALLVACGCDDDSGDDGENGDDTATSAPADASGSRGDASTTDAGETGETGDAGDSSMDTTGATSSDSSATTEASTTGGGSSSGGVAPPDLQTCLTMVDNVEFDNTPPAGETRVGGLGDCVAVLDGASLWAYHCVWCHSTLDQNDIQERTLEKTQWAVDFSESVGNWPQGDLSGDPDAVERIYQALLASPGAVVEQHPHPLPEYE